MNETTTAYIEDAGEIVSKKIRTPRVLLEVKDSNEQVSVKLIRPKNYFVLLQYKIDKWLRKARH